MVRKMARESGYIPNLRSLELRPGTILAKVGGQFQAVGSLWERTRDRGNEELGEILRIATERVTPSLSAGGSTDGAKLSLKYKAGGTSIVSSKDGITMTVSGVEISANIKLSFERRKDYLFDTTEPAPLFVFNDTEMDDVNRAALRYLDDGECVVTSIVWAKKWLWYVSRKAHSTVGIAISGAEELANISVDRLAELSASGSFDVVADSDSCIRGVGENMAAAFVVLRKRRTKLRGEHSPSPMSMSAPDAFMVDGEVVGAARIEESLDSPSEDELLALVGVDDGDDDDDDDDE